MKSGLDLYRKNRLLTDNWRALEAEVFRRVVFSLRQGHEAGGVELAKAVADARILWTAVRDLVSDDSNQLPPDLRQAITSLARALLVEIDKPLPDVDVGFLISATTNVAEGLENKS